MTPQRELAWLISQGRSEADIVHFFVNQRRFTETEAYNLIEQCGVEFGNIRRLSEKLLNDNITPERRSYLQQLSTSDE